MRVAILTGAGKMFSAGADLKNRPDLSAPGATWKRNRAVREVGYGIMECKKPVIAAVNGPALGAGLGIVACCDIVVCSNTMVYKEVYKLIAGYETVDDADQPYAEPHIADQIVPAGKLRYLGIAPG